MATSYFTFYYKVIHVLATFWQRVEQHRGLFMQQSNVAQCVGQCHVYLRYIKEQKVPYHTRLKFVKISCTISGILIIWMPKSRPVFGCIDIDLCNLRYRHTLLYFPDLLDNFHDFRPFLTHPSTAFLQISSFVGV